MTNRQHLYMYKWQVQLSRSLMNVTDGKFIESSVSNIRVLPESDKDLYPLLVQKYMLRPTFRKVKVYFNILNNQYCAVWFLDECQINDLFKRIFGIHKESKTDIIIDIDSFRRNYKISFYRQGLKEPVALPESAYELIVFKNKFEDYRSENYNQPRGAWIW